MNLLEQIELLKRIDALVRRKATGTSKQLANRLGISRTSVFRYIKYLKTFGGSIAYVAQEKVTTTKKNLC